MPPQHMPIRQPGMLEILLGIMAHPDFLHHSPRSRVAGSRERNQFLDP
jgi:hypothetical protein